MVYHASAYCFKESRLATTAGVDLEHNKYVGQIPTIMRIITSKDSDLSSYFDNQGENALGEDGKNIWKQLLKISHENAANKGKIKGGLALDFLFGFCKTFKKIKIILVFI